MKKLSYLIVCSIALVLAACNNEVSISLNPNVLQLKPGDMETISVVGASANIEWASSNEEVATVYHGVVEAKAIGSAVITATVGNRTANCQVYVTGSDGSTLRITPAFANMKRGEKLQLTYGNTYDLEVTWKSSSAAVAEVTNGLVTPKKAGTAKITASYAEEKKTISETMTVKVVSKVLPGNITISGPESIAVGKTGKFVAKIGEAVLHRQRGEPAHRRRLFGDRSTQRRLPKQ